MKSTCTNLTSLVLVLLTSATLWAQGGKDIEDVQYDPISTRVVKDSLVGDEIDVGAELSVLLQGTVDVEFCSSVKVKRALVYIDVYLSNDGYYRNGLETFERSVWVDLWGVYVGTHVWPTSTTVKVVKFYPIVDADTVRPAQRYVLDISENHPLYEGTPINAFDKLKLSINTEVGTLTTAQKDSMRVVMTLVEEYSIDVVTDCPSGRFAKVVAPSSTSSLSANPMKLEWTYEDSSTPCEEKYPMAEVQVLRLYNEKEEYRTDKAKIKTTVDWSKAQRMYVYGFGTSLTFSLAEGTGYYTWRVRPIGNKHDGGPSNPLNWGCWSISANDGASVDRSSTSLSSNVTGLRTDLGTNSVFHYTQFDADKNWQFGREFMEDRDGRSGIVERMVYASRTGRVLQEQLNLTSSGDVVVTQTIPDYQGRPLLKTLPVPVERTGTTPASLGYRPSLLGESGTTEPYTAKNFDGASTAAAPASADGRTASYYGTEALVPESGGYPYSRSLLSNDPLERPVGGGGPGAALRVGSGHTTSVEYVAASNRELISMFGMDAPNDSSVAKTITVDQNDVTSLTYTRNDGKVIASCLLATGPNSNLLDLNDRGNVNVLVQSDTLRWGEMQDDGRIVGAQDFVLSKAATVTFKYLLDPQDFTASCAEFCRSCDYDYIVEVLGSTGSVLHTLSNSSVDSATCPSGTPSSTTYNRNMDPGRYTLRRTLQPKQVTPSRLVKYVDDTRNAHAAQVNTIVKNIFTTTVGVSDVDLMRERQHLSDPKLARRLLHAYKHYRDSIDVDGVATLEINDCCSIVLPITPCSTGCESGVTYDYEQMLIDRWKDSVDAHSSLNQNAISTYFTYYDTTEYLAPLGSPYAGGAGAINALINNMISLSEDPYDCGQVYDCWMAVVEQYWASAWEEYGGQWHRKFNYNLLDNFLDCVGTRYCDTTGFDNVITGDAWLLNAWKMLPRSRDTLEADTCEEYYFDPLNGYVTDCGIDADSANATYQQLRACYASKRANSDAGYKDRWLNDLEANNPDFHRDDLESCDEPCMEGKIAGWVTDCLTECDRRKSFFRDSVVHMYQAANYYVYGAPNNPVLPVDTVETFEIACLLNVLMRSCQEDCQLNVEWDDGHMVSPTAEEIRKHVEAKTAATFRVVMSQGDTCPSDMWRHLENRIPVADYLAEILNEELRLYRDTVKTTLSRWNMEPILRRFLARYPLPSFCLPEVSDSVNPLDTVGLSVNPSSNWTVMVDTTQATQFYVFKELGACELRYQLPNPGPASPGYSPTNPHPLVTMLNEHLNGTWLKKVNGNMIYSYTVNDEVSTSGTDPWTWYDVVPLNPDFTAWHGDSIRPKFSCDVDGLSILYDNWELCFDTVYCINGLPNTLNELGHLIMLALRSKTKSIVQRTASDDSVLYVMSRFEAGICGMIAYTDFVLNAAGDTMSMTLTAGGIPYVWKVPVIGDSTDIDNLIAMGPLTDWLAKFVQLPNGHLGFQVILDGASVTYDLDCFNFFCETPHVDTCMFVRICNVCDTIECGDICFRWVMRDTLTANQVITPLTCAQAEVDRLIGYLEGQLYGSCLQNKIEELKISYNSTCLDPMRIRDQYIAEWTDSMYQYTLYYYDRAGNLVKTIPPKGFIPFNYLTTRAASTGAHKMPTTYAYNTLGQLVREKSPDGGERKFWYDLVGRLRLSQDEKQLSSGKFSFMDYDLLGRVINSGEAAISSATTHAETVSTTTCTANLARTRYTTGNTMPAPYTALVQKNLRNRISRMLADQDADTTTTGDLVYTYYSYDAHGNVEWIIQDLPGPGTPSRVIARTEYEYDLISNKVTKIIYQRGKYDQFFQRYEYDHDQRITKVESSRDGHIWERDAGYTFYKHGPLRRIENGTDRVQGQDYTYTIAGWLKAINHVDIDGTDDPGEDGTDINTGRDAFGMVLGYHTDDYSNSTGTHFESSDDWVRSGKDLYNGNIATWTSNSRGVDGSARAALASVYSYDLINRLRKDEVYKASSSTPYWSQTNPTNWLSEYEYDGNGNITSLKRHTETDLIDDLGYDYPAITGSTPTNRLNFVDDNQTNDALVTYDIDDQASGNYAYDAVGNLTKDDAEGIGTNGIVWTNANKIKSIIKGTTSKLEYIYDATGNRVMKKYYEPTSTLSKTTWYVRDGKGNIIATYEKHASSEFKLVERPMYGANRLGVNQIAIAYTTDSVTSKDTLYSRDLRKKVYELTDHLGNVRATVSDLVVPSSSIFDADVQSAVDYYPFGMAMAERSENQASYGYGFDGQERSDEISGVGNHNTAEYWEYDVRLGRRWNIDPRPVAGSSDYSAMLGNPIVYRDLFGDTTEFFNMAGERLQTINDDLANSRVRIDNSIWSSVYADAVTNSMEVYESSHSAQTALNALSQSIIHNAVNLENTQKKNLIAFETGLVNMSYTGIATTTGGIAHSNGSLLVNSQFDDGFELPIFNVPAVSGNGDSWTLPNGDYAVDYPRARRDVHGMIRDGVGFSMNITPLFDTDRDLLRIHPDGGKVGTAGCIGLQTDASTLQCFYSTVRGMIKHSGQIPLTVNIQGNPNVNNGACKATGGE